MKELVNFCFVPLRQAFTCETRSFRYRTRTYICSDATRAVGVALITAILLAVDVCVRTQSHAWAHIIGLTWYCTYNYRILLYLQCPHVTVYSVQGQIKTIREKHIRSSNVRELSMTWSKIAPLDLCMNAKCIHE